VFCSGLTKAYDDAHLDYKEEIAAVFDKAEEESDRSATAAPALAPFVPDPTQSPQVNAIREQSHRIEQEISAMQDRMSERREPAREDDAAARRLGDMSAIVHDTTIAKLDESQITKLIANFTLSICGIADSSSSNAAGMSGVLEDSSLTARQQSALVKAATIFNLSQSKIQQIYRKDRALKEKISVCEQRVQSQSFELADACDAESAPSVIERAQQQLESTKTRVSAYASARTACKVSYNGLFLVTFSWIVSEIRGLDRNKKKNETMEKIIKTWWDIS
jgi:hypothetical protein